MRTILLAILLAATATSQPKYFVTLPFTEWDFTERRAAELWSMLWEEAAKDTTYPVYLKQSLWWSYQGHEIQFSFDSVQGRGDRRLAMITRHRSISGADTIPEYFHWLPYTGLGYEKNVTDSLKHGAWWGMTLTRDSSIVTISLDKIFGDPTYLGGTTQRALLRFKWRRQAPPFWRAWKDSLP